MRISSLTRRIWGSIGLCSLSVGAPTCFIIYQCLVFATNLTLLTMRGVASMLHMWHYIKVGDIEGILNAGFRFVATITALGNSIAMATHKGKVRDLSKYFGIHARLSCNRAEDISERCIKLSSILINGSYCVISLPFAAAGGFSKYIQSGHFLPFTLFSTFRIK